MHHEDVSTARCWSPALPDAEIDNTEYLLYLLGALPGHLVDGNTIIRVL